jgi:hypothetical protein
MKGLVLAAIAAAAFLAAAEPAAAQRDSGPVWRQGDGGGGSGGRSFDGGGGRGSGGGGMDRGGGADRNSGAGRSFDGGSRAPAGVRSDDGGGRFDAGPRTGRTAVDRPAGARQPTRAESDVRARRVEEPRSRQSEVVPARPGARDRDQARNRQTRVERDRRDDAQRKRVVEIRNPDRNWWRKHRYRVWRPGYSWAAIDLSDRDFGYQIGWCHFHRYKVRGLRFHRDVECHSHARWNDPSLAYVASY